MHVYSTEWWIPDAGISFVGTELAKSPCSPPTWLNTSTHTHTHSRIHAHESSSIPGLRLARSCRLIKFWLVCHCFISLLVPFFIFALCTDIVVFFSPSARTSFLKQGTHTLGCFLSLFLLSLYRQGRSLWVTGLGWQVVPCWSHSWCLPRGECSGHVPITFLK